MLNICHLIACKVQTAPCFPVMTITQGSNSEVLWQLPYQKEVKKQIREHPSTTKESRSASSSNNVKWCIIPLLRTLMRLRIRSWLRYTLQSYPDNKQASKSIATTSKTESKVWTTEIICFHIILIIQVLLATLILIRYKTPWTNLITLKLYT